MTNSIRKIYLLSLFTTVMFLSLLFSYVACVNKVSADEMGTTTYTTYTTAAGMNTTSFNRATSTGFNNSSSTSFSGVSSSSILTTLVDINKINAPEIIAKNAVVYDITNKEFVYTKNATDSVPLASLAKIITATVFLQLNNERHKQNNKIQIIKIVKKNPGYNQGDRELIDGEEWKPENLIRYMLITSSNIAAQSISNSLVDDEFVFSLLMNKFTKDLGYKSFSFKNSSGLSIARAQSKDTPSSKNATSSKSDSSAFGSAKEVAMLFDTIFENIPFLGEASIVPEASFINWSGNTHTVKNVNYSLAQIPNIIAGKTGTTEESGGNLIIEINTNGKKYAIVILGSTIDERYNDAIKLASSTEAFATLK